LTQETGNRAETLTTSRLVPVGNPHYNPDKINLARDYAGQTCLGEQTL
jgi:hypothetical protein